MPTELLYHADSFALELEATVVSHGQLAGKPALVLDRTLFYPESGGQMADRGTLAGVAVSDVQVDEHGAVLHALEGPLPEIGASVHGSVDGARRRVHRAQHTGQHLLSRALVDVAGAETVSSRLGETACTIDVDLAALSEARAAEAEALVNSVVENDVVVRAFFPTADELAALPLRRKAKVESNVRIVLIGDFDVTPCGGTHCSRSAQIGFVRITSLERYKGGTRITFAAGRRAREALIVESAALRALAGELSCAPLDVPLALDKLTRQLAEARDGFGRVQARLAEREAEALLARADAEGLTHIVAEFPGAGPELLRALAARLVSRAGSVALLAGGTSEGTPVLAARAAGSGFECGAFIKRLAERTGGRGGGRPERAEGRLPAGVPFAELARQLLAER